MVLMGIEINKNNHPLTYVESESGEEEVLTPNVLIRGRNTYLLDDIEMTQMSLRRCKKESPRQRTTLEKIATRIRTQLNGKPTSKWKTS
jgi:hypothetical protein